MSFENLKKTLKKVHFIGIGGIGMSAIAEILNNVGIEVQGSDIKTSGNIENLEKKGIKCFIGHEAKNIDEGIDLVVITSIIQDNNPEYIAAKNKGIKIIFRADMLAQIMKEKHGITVAGTHGKTSTTAMVATLLEVGKLDPTVINGGIINYFKSNAKIGNGDYLVAESDESDGSFVRLPSLIGVINNIEPEHLEYYGGDFEKVKECYLQYAKQIPQNGLIAIGIDDKEANKIYQQIKDQPNVVSFGFNENADVTATRISFDRNGSTFDVHIKKSDKIIKELFLPLHGNHNILNSLAVISIADYFRFSENLIREAFAKFEGVKKRFTKTGEVNGVAIIDDYAHHPTEIRATLKAARNLVKDHKIITIFQPHKHSRVQDLFNEFCSSFSDADIVVVADIYKVGEAIEGIDQDALIKGIMKAGNRNVIKLNDKNELPEIVKSNTESGDIVVCVGAGNITNWANELPSLL